jgi:hypothetical protein
MCKFYKRYKEHKESIENKSEELYQQEILEPKYPDLLKKINKNQLQRYFSLNQDIEDFTLPNI